MLEADPAQRVRVLTVWLPILMSDFVAPNTSALARMPDARVRQFWDPEREISRAIAAAARPSQPVPDCCDRDGTLWDVAAVYPKGSRWTEQLPPATFLNGAVIDLPAEIARALQDAAKQEP